MEKVEVLETLVNDLKVDADKFYNKGNKAAGTRVRVALQGLKKLAQEIRLDVKEITKEAVS